jgi:phage tail sheath protein FI
MANFTPSPGVKLNEIDNTYLTGQPINVGAAIIGPTVKGPVEVPTVVTSYSEYKTVFGDAFTSGSDTYSYLTSIAAYNYFNYGGESLLVARVVSGSYTPATSSTLATASSAIDTNGYTTSSYSGVNVFELKTLSEGTIMNNATLGASGSLTNGTPDNIRFEIQSPNASKGTFNVLVRRGDDTTAKPIVLESFNNVSLDPKSSNFISRVIGNQTKTYDATNNQMVIEGEYPNASKYIRVSAVNVLMPNYLDANGVANPAYTGSLPAAQLGKFSGATGTIKGGANFYDSITTQTQGLVAANYDNMVSLLANAEEFKFNIITTPGLTKESHSSVVSTIITNTQGRGDSIYVLDLSDYDSTISETITEAQSLDNSYAATYWPWVSISDPATGKIVWVPASTLIPGVYMNNDRIAAPWFAPAGMNRGGLNTVLRAKYKLSQAQKDELYLNNINPLATMPQQGVVAFGQKTLQKDASALDRVNVRRLLIELKSFIGQVANTIVFEPNTTVTRLSFINRVSPYLETIQQKQGLYAFKVIMDESLNTPDVIDRNQLVGQIYIQPTRTAEFISLDFILQPTGASFPG